MSDTPRETSVARPVEVMQGYLADLASGDLDGASARFSDNLVYVAPGRNALAGETRGRGAAAAWFARMGELSDGSYGITATVDWLGSDTSALLLAREHAVIRGRAHDWTRAVLFSVAEGTITRVQLMEDDQYAYDDWLGGGGDGGGVRPVEPVNPAQPPQMGGDLDDARVRAIMSYQQQVAAGDLASARTIFWPDVTYVVPGRGLLAGTYRGPDEVMGYFGKLFELTDSTYAISRMHWLTSTDRVALATRNHATRGGRSLAWDEIIVFHVVEGRKKDIAHFSGDQYGVDALFGAP